MPSPALLPRPEPPRPDQPPLPLAGLTILAVEDSRFAAEALRLLCQRSGARLRRAEGLHAAAAHLSVYRPDVVIVDLGLPDGPGDQLIRDLAARHLLRPRVLASSGDADGAAVALAAGADAFLLKPLNNLAAFQRAVLGLAGGDPATPPQTRAETLPPPDAQALRDDLRLARGLTARLLHGRGGGRDYLAGFVAGIARSTGDPGLEAAARAARNSPAGLHALDRALARRLSRPGSAFTVAG